jgi:hypothetical protein
MTDAKIRTFVYYMMSLTLQPKRLKFIDILIISDLYVLELKSHAYAALGACMP